jgi:menaquinol-cytochrome c reductase iron-sulfur subunit
MPRQFLRLQGLDEVGSRRRFLANVSFGLSGLIGLMLGVPLIGYVFGPLIRRSPQTWQDVGAVADFGVGETVLAKFDDPTSLPWSGQTSQTAVYVRQAPAGNFDVWAVNCTHLGCPVSWLKDAGLFECPCHGGIYYSNGDVAAGPPPLPLFRHDVRIVMGRVQVLTIPLPTAGFG